MDKPARSLILWFSHLSLADRAAVGGKGASLGELTRANISVPPGFVVTTVAFEQFLAALDPGDEIRREISALDATDDAGIGDISARIRQRIRQAPVPPGIADEIRRAYRRLSGNRRECPVAVRSSATCEDSDDASFAGLQDTYLWILQADEVIEQVRNCWASLYNGESIAYRLRLEIDERQLSIAVVVQEMIDATCAGVMFTRSPTTGDRSVIVVEGSWGLGSCIVNGEVTPDRFVINKVTGEINRRDLSAKTCEHVPDRATGGVIDRAIDDRRRDLPCLSDETLRRLWQIARQVEKHYGCPQDIEWAVRGEPGISDESVYLLQSRPETVWANREREPTARPAAKAFEHVVSLLSAGKDRS